MTGSLKKKLSLPLIGVLILIILVISGFLYLDKFLSGPVEFTDVNIDTKAALKLNALEQISKKNGITEWTLKASSATLLRDEDKAKLIDVSIQFFTKDKKEVVLTSKTGLLNTKTHDMIFSSDVVVTYETFVLKTDRLQYNKKEHILFSDTHVRLEKADSDIEADSMLTKLNDRTTILTGHVKGNFSESFDIQ